MLINNKLIDIDEYNYNTNDCDDAYDYKLW